MKSEKAEKYLYDHECGYPYSGYVTMQDAERAAGLAEQEAEERMREKAHRIVKEMMESIFHGDTPRKIADEFSKKLNENGND